MEDCTGKTEESNLSPETRKTTSTNCGSTQGMHGSSVPPFHCLQQTRHSTKKVLYPSRNFRSDPRIRSCRNLNWRLCTKWYKIFIVYSLRRGKKKSICIYVKWLYTISCQKATDPTDPDMEHRKKDFFRNSDFKVATQSNLCITCIINTDQIKNMTKKVPLSLSQTVRYVCVVVE